MEDSKLLTAFWFVRGESENILNSRFLFFLDSLIPTFGFRWANVIEPL